jgi:hypothetical protein
MLTASVIKILRPPKAGKRANSIPSSPPAARFYPSAPERWERAIAPYRQEPGFLRKLSRQSAIQARTMKAILLA